MPPNRIERLNSLFLREVNTALAGVHDGRIRGIVTITAVSLARDLSIAKVYYSVLGQDYDRQSTAGALERAAWQIRKTVKSRVTLRRIPQIVFEYDPTPEKAAHMESLLDKIRRESGSGAGKQ